ncbi:MAG: sodium-dependent transporter [Schaedlerella sp.]|nr:sodium-dependent transporter [Schaedlerella sp.]
MENKRESFQTNLGFILACVGSAVGMGNIWMFPYRVGQYGGAAFLIPYIIFVVVLGITGVAGEMAFGRAMQSGPLGAFRKATETRGNSIGEWVGLIPTIGSMALAIGYSVIVGWIIRYLVSALSGKLLEIDTTEYFVEMCGDFGSLPWHLTGIVIVLFLMVLGVEKGIEKINKIMMPLFFCLFLILAIRVAFLDGATEGYLYLFKPEWKQLQNVKTWVYALGQAFFSLSLAGSGTIVYGSYLKKTEDVTACAQRVAVFDTIAAMLAALVIIPSVFVFNLDLSAGPGLMFITMPNVFQMLPLGQIFGMLFFWAVLFAAITSMVNLFESPVEALQTKFGLSRKWSVMIIMVIGTLGGILIENGDTVSKWMDIVSIYIVPLGALLAAVMFFWICPNGFARDQVQLGRERKIADHFEFLTKYIFVGLTVAVYILGILYGGIG